MHEIFSFYIDFLHAILGKRRHTKRHASCSNSIEYVNLAFKFNKDFIRDNAFKSAEYLVPLLTSMQNSIFSFFKKEAFILVQNH